VFAASPETIRREPREFDLRRSVGKWQDLAACALCDSDVFLLPAGIRPPRSCGLLQARNPFSPGPPPADTPPSSELPQVSPSAGFAVDPASRWMPCGTPAGSRNANSRRSCWRQSDRSSSWPLRWRAASGGGDPLYPYERNGRHVGTQTPDLYRVNFEFNNLKPFACLAFLQTRYLKTPRKQPIFGDEWVTSFCRTTLQSTFSARTVLAHSADIQLTRVAASRGIVSRKETFRN
jgi:hypothetical protein